MLTLACFGVTTHLAVDVAHKVERRAHERAVVLVGTQVRHDGLDGAQAVDLVDELVLDVAHAAERGHHRGHHVR